MHFNALILFLHRKCLRSNKESVRKQSFEKPQTRWKPHERVKGWTFLLPQTPNYEQVNSHSFSRRPRDSLTANYVLTGWQSCGSIQALICEWIHSVDRSLIELRRNASKSRKTSFFLSLYRAGWWGIIDAKSRFLQPSFTNITLPGAWGWSGSGLTVTSNSLI